MGGSLTKEISAFLNSQGYELASDGAPGRYKVLGSKINHWDVILHIQEDFINTSLVVGCFEMDFGAQEIFFSSSVITRAISSPLKMFTSLFSRHTATLKRIAPQIVAALNSPLPYFSHFGITCDGCKVTPIVGERFKCAECEDYDLCHKCKVKGIHQHSFKRYTTPLAIAVEEKNNNVVENPKKDIPNAVGNDALNNPQTIRPTPSVAEPQTKVVPSSQIKFQKNANGKKIKLGAGASATVYLAKWHGTEVAVKVINKNLPPDVVDLFKAEVSVMSHLHHPHIILMLGFCEDPPSIILPVMKHGSLQKIIQSKSGDFSLKLKYLINAAKGMAFIHGNHVIHGDLKPDNVLVDENNVAYIADFGLSKIKASTTALVMGTMAKGATPLYQAPEFSETGVMTASSDVYAFGILMWATLTMCTPFLGQFNNQRDFELKIKNGLRPNVEMFPPGTPQAFKTLAEECWNKDPAKRPDFLTILDKLEKMRA